LLSKNTTYINQQYVNIILHSWQHVLAVNSHHQAKIESSTTSTRLHTQVMSGYIYQLIQHI